MMPSGHKAFVVSNVKDVELLLMHNKVYAAEYVLATPTNPYTPDSSISGSNGAYRPSRGHGKLTWRRIAHNVSSRKRIDIIARAKQLSVKVTNPKAKVTTEV